MLLVIALIVGLIIGGLAGVLLMASLFLGASADRQMALARQEIRQTEYGS